MSSLLKHIKNEHSCRQSSSFEDFPKKCPTCKVSLIFAGRYFLGKFKGKGGFSYVLEAWDQEIQEVVIVKFLNRKDTSEDVSRFKREGYIGEKVITSRHLVGARDFGKDQSTDLHYIVQPYAQGTTLFHYIFKNPREINKGKVEVLSWKERLEIAVELAEILTELERYNINHRDLNPKNIIIKKDKGYILKIIDFGSAEFNYKDERPRGKSVEEFTRKFKEEGEEYKVLKHAYYESCGPEVIGSFLSDNNSSSTNYLKVESFDLAYDLFSVGVCLFSLFFGKHPHDLPPRPKKEVSQEKWEKYYNDIYEEKQRIRKDSLQAKDIFENIFNDETDYYQNRKRDTQKLRKNCEQLTRRLEKTVRKCLSPEPKDRLDCSNSQSQSRTRINEPEKDNLPEGEATAIFVSQSNSSKSNRTKNNWLEKELKEISDDFEDLSTTDKLLGKIDLQSELQETTAILTIPMRERKLFHSAEFCNQIFEYLQENTPTGEVAKNMRSLQRKFNRVLLFSAILGVLIVLLFGYLYFQSSFLGTTAGMRGKFNSSPQNNRPDSGFEKKISSLVNSVSRIEKKGKNLRKEIASLEANTKKKEREQVRLGKDLASIEERISILSDKLNKYSSVKERLAKIEKSFSRDPQGLEKNFENRLSKTKKEVEELSSLIKEIPQKIKRLGSELAKAKTKIKELKASSFSGSSQTSGREKLAPKNFFRSFQKVNLVLGPQELKYTINKTPEQYGVLVWLKWEKGKVEVEVQFSAQGDQAKSIKKEVNLSWPKWILGEKNLFFLIAANRPFSAKKVEEFCRKFIRKNKPFALNSGNEIRAKFQQYLKKKWKSKGLKYWIKVDVVFKQNGVIKQVP